MPYAQNEKDLITMTSMIYLMDLSCWMWMRWICQQEVELYQQRYDCSSLPISVGNMLMKWSQDTVKYENGK